MVMRMSGKPKPVGKQYINTRISNTKTSGKPTKLPILLPKQGKPKPVGKIHAPRPVGGNPKRITRPKSR